MSDAGIEETAGPQVAPVVSLPASRPRRPAGSMPSLTAATARPDEAVTAGLPVGAGPGPEVLRGLSIDEALADLRAVYRQHPDERIRRLIQHCESEK